jgi:hypothetical protein
MGDFRRPQAPWLHKGECLAGGRGRFPSLTGQPLGPGRPAAVQRTSRNGGRVKLAIDYEVALVGFHEDPTLGKFDAGSPVLIF